MPEHQFNTWIRPLAASNDPQIDHSGPTTADVVSVRVSNRFKLDWIRTQYASQIESVLTDLAGKPMRLDLTLAPRNDPTGSPAPRHAAGATPLAGHAAQALNLRDLPSPGALISARSQAPAATSHRLNTALTFDTLVAGRANQMARTAALHVAGAPGAMYNPLFIYGGVGLGKTHLVHAVGNSLLKDNPHARVLYLHAEQFISDVVKNYQRKTFDEL